MPDGARSKVAVVGPLRRNRARRGSRQVRASKRPAVHRPCERTDLTGERSPVGDRVEPQHTVLVVALAETKAGAGDRGDLVAEQVVLARRYDPAGKAAASARADPARERKTIGVRRVEVLRAKQDAAALVGGRHRRHPGVLPGVAVAGPERAVGVERKAEVGAVHTSRRHRGAAEDLVADLATKVELGDGARNLTFVPVAAGGERDAGDAIGARIAEVCAAVHEGIAVGRANHAANMRGDTVGRTAQGRVVAEPSASQQRTHGARRVVLTLQREPECGACVGVVVRCDRAIARALLQLGADRGETGLGRWHGKTPYGLIARQDLAHCTRPDGVSGLSLLRCRTDQAEHGQGRKTP
ncbi:MAG: hypothetical protein RLZZ450_3561 [Pseudomonadota bacterium]